MVRGVFVTLEGGDGAGKSTQTRLLADWLRIKGQEVVKTFEPGGTEVGQKIRDLLLHGNALPPRAEALLFAADRAHHVENVIRPALSRGAVVVSDRYIDSSIAYQGSGRALNGDDIEKLSEWATDVLLPDLTVILDVPVAEGTTRRGGNPDRLERESIGFHESVRQAFLDQAEKHPERYLVLDARESIDDLHREITGRVDALLETT